MMLKEDVFTLALQEITKSPYYRPPFQDINRCIFLIQEVIVSRASHTKLCYPFCSNILLLQGPKAGGEGK